MSFRCVKRSHNPRSKQPSVDWQGLAGHVEYRGQIGEYGRRGAGIGVDAFPRQVSSCEIRIVSIYCSSLRREMFSTRSHLACDHHGPPNCSRLHVLASLPTYPAIHYKTQVSISTFSHQRDGGTRRSICFARYTTQFVIAGGRRGIMILWQAGSASPVSEHQSVVTYIFIKGA